MKCYLVINPRSRGGKASRHFETIFRLMEEEGLEYDYVFSSSYEGMYKASAFAQDKDYDAVVAVGGDGTINAVINGFYDEKGDLLSSKKFGVIYTGTSPDFCKSYGVPTSLKEGIAAISTGDIRSIRTGLVSFSTEPSGKQKLSRHFACCASVGIGAMVASRANKLRKYLGDFWGTLLSILISLVRFRTAQLTMATKEELRKVPSVTNIFVGRTKYIASGIKATQEMGADDRRFYIITVKSLRLKNLVRLFQQIYSGNIQNSEVTDVSYSERLQIQPDGVSYELEFDGDPVGYTPCTFQLSAVCLDLICSPCDQE